jgi:predicted acetyltransferase
MSHLFQLEEPHEALRESYLDLIREFVERGEALIPFVLGFANEDFGAFLDRLAGCARGEGLPAGFVPHSTYWLVRDGMVVGVSNLRHSLTDKLRREGGHIGYGVRPSVRGQGIATRLLRETLVRARCIGLQEVLVICDKGNEASARTIINNGGVLSSEEFLADCGEVVQRYTIRLDGNVDG